MTEINEYIEALHRLARGRGYSAISVQTLQVIMMNYIAIYNPPMEPGRKMYKVDEAPVGPKLATIAGEQSAYDFEANMKAHAEKKAKLAAARAKQDVKGAIRRGART